MKPSSAVLVAGSLALLPACTPGRQETIVGRWQAGDEQIEFGEDRTFQISREEWSLRLCEMNEPARCTEYQRVETENR